MRENMGVVGLLVSAVDMKGLNVGVVEGKRNKNKAPLCEIDIPYLTFPLLVTHDSTIAQRTPKTHSALERGGNSDEAVALVSTLNRY